MGKEEFIKRARELGYTKEMIEEIIQSHEEEEKLGIESSYDDENLTPIIISYPRNKFNKVARKYDEVLEKLLKEWEEEGV